MTAEFAEDFESADPLVGRVLGGEYRVLLERLVDAVPASYFCLPPATRAAPMPEAFGNTGMIQLVEDNRRPAGHVALAGVLAAVLGVLALALAGL